MNSVAYPRLSSLRALSRHSAAEPTCETCTPKRKGLVIVRSLSVQSGDDRCERLDRLVRDHDVRHLPALAPLLTEFDNAVGASDERGRCKQRVGGRDTEALGDRVGD